MMCRYRRRFIAALAAAIAIVCVGFLPAAAAPVSVTKVLMFIEENHSLAEMKAGMPYLYSQATTYGYATNYTAIRHPSLPNYLAIAGGSTRRLEPGRPRPGKAHETYRHECVLYAGTGGFLDALVPFVRDGLARQEPRRTHHHNRVSTRTGTAISGGSSGQLRRRRCPPAGR
jgi:hypothetical protein